jgi:hypothetical protein
MTKQQIFQYIDDAIAIRWESITAKQEYFYQARGLFFQGLLTHTELPKDGAEVPPDNAEAKPHYQNESWLDMGELPPAMAAALRCDTYQSPNGAGYVITAEVEIDGTVYEKAINVGCEEYRSFNWRAKE